MNYQLKPKDFTFVALGLIGILALGAVARGSAHKAEIKRQNSAMIVQMTREMGLPVVDTSQTKDDPNLERDNQLEQASALKSAVSPR